MITFWQGFSFLLFTIVMYYLSIEISRKAITPSKAFLFLPIYIGWLIWLIMILLTVFQSTIKNIFI